MTSSSGGNEAILILSNSAGEIRNTGTMTNAAGGQVIRTGLNVDVDIVPNNTTAFSGDDFIL